jgi:formiminotetrahydrofolate cyclodeaminase
MTSFAELSVREFLAQVAGRTPVPGGGAVAATAGALACAMAEMVAAYAPLKNATAEARRCVEDGRQELVQLREMLQRLADEDAVAYEQIVESRRARDANPSAYAAALGAGISVPMAIAGMIVQALEIMARISPWTGRPLRSDLGVAAVLADGAARAARYTVRVNLPELSDAASRSRLLADIDRIVARGERLRSAVERFVDGTLPPVHGGPSPT